MPPRTSYGTSRVSQYVRNSGATAQQVRVHIVWEPAARAYKVEIPYDENFVEFIKAKIPGNKRAWDGAAKAWFIEDGYHDALVVLATELWGTQSVRFVSRKEVEDAEIAAQIAQRSAVLAALPLRERCIVEFSELLSLDALKAAYRKAAMELHPDRASGDTEKMTKLNAAWAALEKELSQNGHS